MPAPVYRGKFEVGCTRNWAPELGLKRGKNGYAYELNSEYEVGLCHYQTDISCARVVLVYGLLILRMAPRHKSHQGRVNKLVNLRGDDAGHLIASQFYGTGQAINLVPMASRLNQHGEWRKMELEIERFLRSPQVRSVSISIKLSYPDRLGLRPSQFDVSCDISFHGGRVLTKRYHIVNA